MATDHLGRRFIIGFLIFLPLWTFTKVPFYLAFKRDGPTANEKMGLEQHINMEYWIPGFHGAKLRAPPFNFLLIHIAAGSTVLIMTALSLINKSWRRNYGKYFFVAAFILGAHSVPASILQPTAFMYWLFMFANVACIGLSTWGLLTLFNFDKDPIKAHKYLLIQYVGICIVASTAAVFEVLSIVKNFFYKWEQGVYPSFGDEPHPLTGTTFYDNFPEWIGLLLFLTWVAVVGLIWPIGLLNLNGGYQALDNASVV